MPKIVDHDHRREQLARAFQRHLVQHGLAATTFSGVAAEAGTSVGTIQHYFSSREDLLRFAFQECLTQRNVRLQHVIDDGETAEQPIRLILATALAQLLPLDDTRRREHQVAQNLHVLAQHDATLREVLVAAESVQHDRVRTAIANGKECGEVAHDVDEAASATLALATTTGLATHITVDPATAGVAQVLSAVLGTVFTGRCRRHDRPVSRHP